MQRVSRANALVRRIYVARERGHLLLFATRDRCAISLIILAIFFRVSLSAISRTNVRAIIGENGASEHKSRDTTRESDTFGGDDRGDIGREYERSTGCVTKNGVTIRASRINQTPRGPHCLTRQSDKGTDARSARLSGLEASESARELRTTRTEPIRPAGILLTRYQSAELYPRPRVKCLTRHLAELSLSLCRKSRRTELRFTVVFVDAPHGKLIVSRLALRKARLSKSTRERRSRSYVVGDSA